jgi:hypothetical protein
MHALPVLEKIITSTMNYGSSQRPLLPSIRDHNMTPSQYMHTNAAELPAGTVDAGLNPNFLIQNSSHFRAAVALLFAKPEQMTTPYQEPGGLTHAASAGIRERCGKPAMRLICLPKLPSSLCHFGRIRKGRPYYASTPNNTLARSLSSLNPESLPKQQILHIKREQI